MAQTSGVVIRRNFLEMLLRGINHDCSAPIRHINFFTQSLIKKSDILNTQQLEHLNHILNASDDLKSMIESISALAKISMSEQKVELISPKQLLTQALEHIRTDFVVNDLPIDNFNIKEQGNWLSFSGKSDHWYEIFYELLKNALLYHPKDSTHIKKVTVECNICNTSIKLTIADNGIGIREANLVGFPKAFRRLNADQDYPGRGMGLMNCWMIAELNQAKLSFNEDSSLGGLSVSYEQAID